MRIRDVSQPLGRTTAVWPGDEPVAPRWTLRQDRGDSVNVAALTASVHAGTHADGALHVDAGAAPIGERALEPYIGRARLIDATGRDRLEPALLDGIDAARAQRLLFRTRPDADPTVFPDRVAAVSPALARRAADAGVRLIGTDAPSVDPLDSTELEAHRILVDAGVAILENLALADVEPGEYTLVALPLRLAEADSSPVRAVLLEEDA